MKYLKTLALLITLSTLASCEQGFEDFPADVYSKEEVDETRGAKSNEPNDTTGSGPITIIIDDTEVVDVDCIINIP